MRWRPPGRPVVRSSAAALLLLAAIALPAAEPLLCRGFAGGSAASAITSRGGPLLRLDPDLRQIPVWLVLVDVTGDPARQALAHALGCWWGTAALTRSRALPDRDLSVRVYPPLPQAPAGAESMLRPLLEPWLAGNGGLVLDAATGAWSATAAPEGHRHLERILNALSDPHPQAPHLIPPPALPAIALPRPPAGRRLGDWCLDLGRLAGVPLALAGDADPTAPPPAGTPTTLGEGLDLLHTAGLRWQYVHGAVCIAAGAIDDRQHPGERARVAMLPTGHLTRDPVRLASLAEQLRRRAVPTAWIQPGWSIVALPDRECLLVTASSDAIHAVMTALDAADQAGLNAWLR